MTTRIPPPSRRSQRAQSLIEALVGSLLLVPIALAGLDLTVLVLTNSANDDLAKNAARAAADQGTKPDAVVAAKQCILKFPKSTIIVDVDLAGDIDYTAHKQVAVQTVMTVKLPVAFPGADVLQFHAQAVEPLVALPAEV